MVVEEARPKKDSAVDIDDVMAMFEAEPNGKEEMAAARQWVGSSLDDQETLKAIRLARGMSQAELAESVGLQQPNISAIESGKRKPEYDTAQKLAKSLQLSVEEVYAAFNRSQEG